MSVDPAAAVAEANPLRQALPRTRVPDPCAVVLFGATGDLTHRKLVPALYHLDQGGHLAAEVAIVGFARRDWSDQQFRDELKKSLANPKDAGFEAAWTEFSPRISYNASNFDEPDGLPEAQGAARQDRRLARDPGQSPLLPGRLPRILLAVIVEQLGQAGLI